MLTTLCGDEVLNPDPAHLLLELAKHLLLLGG